MRAVSSLPALIAFIGLALWVQPVRGDDSAQATAVSGLTVVSDPAAMPFGLHLAQMYQEEQEIEAETTKSTTRTSFDQDWIIDPPITLQAADPLPTGMLELQNVFGYSTSSDKSDDDTGYQLNAEWGIAPNHSIQLSTSFDIGDGQVDGNGDLTLYWHWRLWKEEDWYPAFAMRNYVRIPTGVGSSGVDYQWHGLLTKSIIPDKFRCHLNGQLKSINGNNIENVRHFQWAVVAGVDYRLTDDLTLVADYLHESSQQRGDRNQNYLEAAIDWNIAPQHEVTLTSRFGLNHDGAGENWEVLLSYSFWLTDMPACGK
ncbi:MAG: hypothetical protein JSU68_11105 [Phycisphaerales bacterium]|nr:MAG: hypothetical protein JSU68_11105 [Phycisphaerales bacterium]